MLRLAITANSMDIIEYITSNDLFMDISGMGLSIIPSKENLFLAISKADLFCPKADLFCPTADSFCPTADSFCPIANISIMEILLKNIKKDKIPKLIKYAKTFNNKDMISFLQKIYNSKLIEEKR